MLHKVYNTCILFKFEGVVGGGGGEIDLTNNKYVLGWNIVVIQKNCEHRK